MRDRIYVLLFSWLCMSQRFCSVEAAVPDDQGRPSPWKLAQLFRRNNSGRRLPKKQDGFTILEETLVYSGWRTIVQRKVKMRNGKVVDFDVSATYHVVVEPAFTIYYYVRLIILSCIAVFTCLPS